MTGCSLRATALVHEKACLYRGSADNRNAVTGRHEMEELWMCLFVYVVVDGCRDERLCEQTCYTGRREREGGIQEESKARERERGGERAEEGESWCERDSRRGSAGVRGREREGWSERKKKEGESSRKRKMNRENK